MKPHLLAATIVFSLILLVPGGAFANQLPGDGILSVLKQYASSVPLDNIQCKNPEHFVALRDNGKPICATERTLEHLGLDMTYYNPKPTTTSGTITLDDKTHIPSNPQTTNATTGIITNDLAGQIADEGFPMKPFWPKYTIEFPIQVMVGEQFNVVYNYAYVIPDDEGSYEEYEYICERDYCQDDKLYFSAPDYVTIHNNDLVDYGVGTNTMYLPFQTYQGGFIENIYDASGPQKKTFTLAINEPNTGYRYGKIMVTMNSGDDTIYFHVDKNGNVELTQDVLENFAGYNEYASIHAFTKDGNYLKYIGDDSDYEQDMLYQRGFLSELPSVKEKRSIEPLEVPHDEILEGFADFLLKYYPHDNYREYLLEPVWDLDAAFLDRLFELRPDLEPQRFSPVLNFLLPQAFGQMPSFSYVFGNLVNEDKNGNEYYVKNAKICAVDHHINKSNPGSANLSRDKLD